MKIDIFNINDFIRVNHCKEVTNPIFFNFDKTPSIGGLFDPEIFGYTTEERKNMFGYIDLKGKFIHPAIYKILNGRMGSIRDIISGIKYAVVANGKIKIVDEDFKGAQTGLSFIYDNFDQIDWINELDEEEMASMDKKTRLKFIKSIKKDEFFVDKWLVLPPYYRDENTESSTMGDIVNKLYKELLSKCKSLKSGFGFDSFGEEVKLRIQNLIKTIYDITLGPLTGKSYDEKNNELVGDSKNSLFRRHVLGKFIDYTTSNVITAPANSDAVDGDHLQAPFGHCLYPLRTVMSLFKPFFVHEVGDYLTSVLSDLKASLYQQIKKIDMNQFSADKVDKLLSKFIKSEYGIDDPIIYEFVGTDNTKKGMYLTIEEYKTEQDAREKKNAVVRPYTYFDLLYISALEIVKDKHCYNTRYPVANNQNIYPTRVKVASTTKTRKVWLRYPAEFDSEPVLFENYPYIDFDGNKERKSSLYYELYNVMIIGNGHLKSLGADYDGDMIYTKPIFSKEANDEAERLIFSKTNLLNASGEVSRGLTQIGKDCVLGIYELTRDD